MTRIEPTTQPDGKFVDMVGIVTTLEGTPLPKGAIEVDPGFGTTC